jgi:hypothetical protein
MFTVWSPFDGEPIPTPNETERDILISQGYLAEPPDRAGWTEPSGGFATGAPVDDSATRLVGEDAPELTDLPPRSEGASDPGEP